MVFDFVHLQLLFNLFSTALLADTFSEEHCRNNPKNTMTAVEPTTYKAYAGQQLHVSCDAYEMYIMSRRANTALLKVRWYKITDRLVAMEKQNETVELFRIHRFLEGGVLHIISVQPTLHAGKFYCELIDANCNIYGSYVDIEVSVCKWRKKGYRGYCAYGVCKVRNNSLKHITMTCTCEPGYSGAYCTYPTK
ncbi:hypothetical protein D918_00654 [Trichuris suis]|nr:hypothetical protein D918_00654 [Trichuris suis]